MAVGSTFAVSVVVAQSMAPVRSSDSRWLSTENADAGYSTVIAT